MILDKDCLLLVYTADWHHKVRKVHPFNRFCAVQNFLSRWNHSVRMLDEYEIHTYAMSTRWMQSVFLGKVFFFIRFVSSFHLPLQWDRAFNWNWKHGFIDEPSLHVHVSSVFWKWVLLKRGTENGTENGTEWKTEWNGKYAMPYTYTCVKHIYTIFVWITRLSSWQCRCTVYSP